MEDGMCRLVATLPQLDERSCPDMFRCSDEVSYWLHENEERKQQIVALKETISELQEELRNHRHRIKVLELQVTKADVCKNFYNSCVTSCCSVEDEEHQYRLHVSGFSGTVQDSFGWYHDKQHFSTPDTGNICAEISHGGWWYNQCFYANLNGVYYRVSTHRKLLLLHFQKHKCLLHFADSTGRPLHSKRSWLTGS
ncbi:hypothetical protein XENOCAPTIV_021058 [Xenoophorus captivus]|uniref:Fibrinogen C-terminal domain-containing protein n=1 Tax=Xenoophorus captivus TaxID=1517983 RepID=A0ABV0S2P4_9TELE